MARRTAIHTLLSGAIILALNAGSVGPGLAAGPRLRVDIELDVPLVQQHGEVSNCGPSAMAMVLSAYGRGEPEVLRDRIGRWSWAAFPLRRLSLPGGDAGMTTPAMMHETLERFGEGLTFLSVAHRWLPPEVFAMPALEAAVAGGRPVLVLVQSSTLWNMPKAVGLHWVVVTGVEGDVVIFNDPADRTRNRIARSEFLKAWRLDPVFRELPLVAPFTALSADAPLEGGEPDLWPVVSPDELAQ